MAELNDDVLLCVFEHCDIDTFLHLRLLSRSILKLINRNIDALSQKVAHATFPRQQDIFASSQPPITHDVNWLKYLRFKQLAAILVECTNQNNNGNNLLNADNPRGDAPRMQIFVAFRILSSLQHVAFDVSTTPDHELLANVEFSIPDVPVGVRRHFEKRRLDSKPDGLWNPSPILGNPKHAPFALAGDAVMVWRRRLTILQRQLDYLKSIPRISHRGSCLLLLQRALMYEFDGRRDDRASDKPWDKNIPTAQNLLNQRSWWLWTTILDLGPAAFWREWTDRSSSRPRLLRTITDLWECETFYEKTMKCFSGHAFFISLGRMMRELPHCSVGARSRGPRPFTVFGYGRAEVDRNTGLPELDETPRSFEDVHFDLQLNPDDCRFSTDELPNEQLPLTSWYHESGAF